MNEILTAFLVISGIGLVLGILLAVVSHLFRVEEDPTLKQVRECLPGINCGACGYKGCDDYAAALTEGGVSPSLCVPGAQATAQQIGAILGLEAEPLKDVVAFVACNGHREATHPQTRYDGVPTCRGAAQVNGGPGACQFGCLGYGDCAFACPSDAICIKDGIAHVDTTRCLGCGLCAKTCPKGIIHMVPQHAAVVVMCSSKAKGADARKACQNACIACKKCEKTCPHGAITVVDNLAVIDYDTCTGCGACAAVCPTGCLKQASFPDLTAAPDALLHG